MTRGAARDSGWAVTGTITVGNPDPGTVSDVDVTEGGVTSGTPAAADPNASCTVTDGHDRTIAPNSSIEVAYRCSGAPAPAHDAQANTATVTWDRTFSDGAVSPSGSASDGTPFTFADPTVTDDCVTLSDTFGGPAGTTTGDVPAGTVCASAEFRYTRAVPLPALDCASHVDTATAVEADSAAERSGTATVTVCGPARTAARTIGFWQNKNGQDLISGGGSVAGTCTLTGFLRLYAPLADGLTATASCKTVAAYVMGVIKAANASGAAMNAMLKAQMLATALDGFFTSTAGGNKLGAPSPLGDRAIDLTLVCKLSTAGGCGAMQDVSSVFGGAPKTVTQMLEHASSRFDVATKAWYGNVKATQELAKNAFDAINNEKVFAATTP